jgi:pyruvate kinase
VRFGKPNAVDFVALSFTRSAADVAEARAYLDAIGMRNTKIIAKIENKVGAHFCFLGGAGFVAQAV